MPDKTHQPRYVDGEVAEILYSDDEATRAVIVRGNDTLFRLYWETWSAENVSSGRPAAWLPLGASSIFDALESARTTARMELTHSND